MTFPFLPTNKTEMDLKGWDTVDVILISGDAYVDHPSFGTALIGRYLESKGYKVGIIPQPDWTSDTDFQVMGKPNLFFGVSAGNMDSMIGNYNSEKHSRKQDMYTENNLAGKRPDRAVIVYANCVKKLYPDSMIVIGGIEASLRRISHYDYWSNKIRRSILIDSRADILVYGMGEKAIDRIASRLRNQASLDQIPNTVILSNHLPQEKYILLPSHEDVISSKIHFLKSFNLIHEEACIKNPSIIVQEINKKFLTIYPPDNLTTEELDSLFTLPFTRKAHPQYIGEIPAYSFVKHSVLSHRGCYGGCSFCTLNLQQGKFIVSRSEKSILNEIQNVLCKMDDFKGTILDIGGPSANMYGSTCSKLEGCKRASCIHPSICNHLKVDQLKHLSLLQKTAKTSGVNHVFVNSGIRYDLALSCEKYIESIVSNHIGGQMSIAPEHTSDKVLKLMNKPSFSIYEKFISAFNSANKKAGKKQFVVPYFIAAHPGSTIKDMYHVALYLRKNHMKIEQVQNFIPIPMTLSSAMYYTGLDPKTLQSVYIPKGEERNFQRALLQPTIKRNLPLVKKALQKIDKLNDLSYFLTTTHTRENTFKTKRINKRG
ncbi:MAG: YgiQ family radical SAM protein [Candidatus Margulisbacteria bacterium GWF2_35_9]|nr:MAG: YgiQ family radical SAM protein [Candidatus Margulisbacteria bacterium GWF2_35_9]